MYRYEYVHVYADVRVETLPCLSAVDSELLPSAATAADYTTHTA